MVFVQLSSANQLLVVRPGLGLYRLGVTRSDTSRRYGVTRAMFPVKQLRDYLGYTWRLQRRITHHQTYQVVTIEGIVTWEVVGGAAEPHTDLYHENCVMHLEQYTAKASQTYRYQFPSDSIAEVSFSDGRLFYVLDLTTSHCDIHHLCGEDTYTGVIDVMAEREYRQIWQVRGPRKDYTSHTVFSR